MRAPFRPGDPVTLILPDHVVMAPVHMSAPTWFMVVLSSRGAKTYESKWQLSEEGIDWLDGYFLADSPEVAACRTAQALGQRHALSDEKQKAAAKSATDLAFRDLIKIVSEQ